MTCLPCLPNTRQMHNSRGREVSREESVHAEVRSPTKNRGQSQTHVAAADSLPEGRIQK